MSKLSRPLHGIRQNPTAGWEVWSFLLQYPIQRGSPSDAKRVAAALELAHPCGGPVDYGEVDAAIAASKATNTVANLRLVNGATVYG